LRICAQSEALWGVRGVGWLSYVLRREPAGLIDFLALGWLGAFYRSFGRDSGQSGRRESHL
jgi:hypothetical protein